MLTFEDFDVATGIVKQLNIPERFGYNIDDDHFYSEELQEQLDKINICPCCIDSGITKAVIIPDNYNFVIKIPFNGYWYYSFKDEDDDEGEETFESFYRAEAPDNTDYCWDELIKILDAQEAGFGELFPQTALLFEQSGMRFYIQEKVRTSRQFKSTPSAESMERASTIDNKFKKCDQTWRATVFDVYGEGYWKSFINWDYNNTLQNDTSSMLSDMHRGNYGYNMEGAPVILDVAGYRED